MKKLNLFSISGTSIPLGLVATAFIGIITAIGLVNTLGPTADIRIEPRERVVEVGSTFTIQVVVESSNPVNVFAGEVNFSQDVLDVVSIDYNTSIADLWTQEPWYSKGEGRLIFAGGTTKAGGFVGEGAIMSVTFKTLKVGEGKITTSNTRILQHDGLGTDSEIADPIDAIVQIGNIGEVDIVSNIEPKEPKIYKVVEQVPSTDLNGDGKQSIADISIFMLNIAGSDSKYDFNLDGKIDLKDLNIILSVR
jgi:hypothetical protein